MRVRFYRDDAGYPYCDFPEGFELLGDFLTNDVQGAFSAKVTLAFIKENRHIEANRFARVAATGNGFTLVVWREGASIINAYEEDPTPLVVNIDFMNEIVEYWAEFLKSKEPALTFITQHNPRSVNTVFPVFES